MLFGFYAKGYKGVAYDLVTGLSAAEAASFPVKPEKSNDYEAGIRSEWLDHRVAVNVTCTTPSTPISRCRRSSRTFSTASF